MNWYFKNFNLINKTLNYLKHFITSTEVNITLFSRKYKKMKQEKMT